MLFPREPKQRINVNHVVHYTTLLNTTPYNLLQNIQHKIHNTRGHESSEN